MVYNRAAPLVNLRNQHFQNAGRGLGTGPSGPHFENVDFEGKGLKAATPPPWGCAWVPLGCPWAPLGCPWAPFGLLWGALGLLWGALGLLWGALGLLLGCPWAPMGPKALGTVLGGATVNLVCIFTARSAFLELIRGIRGIPGIRGSAGSGVINYGSGPPFHARRGSG